MYDQYSQVPKAARRLSRHSSVPFKRELIIPNPKLKLLEQVREVMRLRHYSIRTERTYCDWIRRYIQFHKMQNREELQEGEGKIEVFLSDLAVNKNVSASTDRKLPQTRPKSRRPCTSKLDVRS